MKRKLSNTFTLYTLFFVVACIVMLSFFLNAGKSLIWRNDGLYQHYNAFLYLGSWIREFLKNLLFKHTFSLPMWNWGIGYGGDVITTLSYYVIGDPFSLISVFTPYKYGEIGYTLAIVLRFYAAGLTFCLYCRKMDCKKWATICAALMYVFCNYSLTAGVRHPYFMSPMIYLPLVLYGCEKILRKESKLPFILAVFVSAISNFYFLYMIAIFTVLYVMIRLLSEPEYRKARIIGKYFVQFLLCAMLSAGLSAILLLPNAMAVLNSSRVNNTYSVHLFYDKQDYKRLFFSFWGIADSDYFGYVGIAPLIYLGIGAFLMNHYKKEKWTVIFFALQILFLIFPAAGYALNGFGYVSDRWVFAFTFSSAYMFAKGLPDLLQPSKWQRLVLSAGLAVYCLICVILKQSTIKETIIFFILLELFLLIIWTVWHVIPLKHGKPYPSGHRIQQAVIVVFSFLLIFLMMYFKYSGSERNYVHVFRDKDMANNLLAKRYASVYPLIKDDGFYRIDGSCQKKDTQRNYLLLSPKNTTFLYWSIINPNIRDFFWDNSITTSVSYRILGLNSRAWIMPLFSAKYYITDAKDKSVIPYGLKYMDSKKSRLGKYALYQNKNALPFGYTYDQIISMKEYKNMSFVKRQQAMIQGAVLEADDFASAGLTECMPSYTDKTIPYKIIGLKNAVVEDNKITITKENAKVVLQLKEPARGDLYISVSGLDFKGTFDSSKKKQSKKYRIPKKTGITASSKGKTANISYYTKYDTLSEGRTDYLMNLCYSKKGREKITLEFKEPGIYTYNDISVISQPMDKLSSYVTARKENQLENLQMHTNHISGTITLEKKKLLCLSLPYSEGWSLKVDGHKTDLLKTNIMFSGVILEPGTHTIELAYCTPYLIPGMLISGISLIILITFILFERRCKNSVKNSKIETN